MSEALKRSITFWLRFKEIKFGNSSRHRKGGRCLELHFIKINSFNSFGLKLGLMNFDRSWGKVSKFIVSYLSFCNIADIC